MSDRAVTVSRVKRCWLTLVVVIACAGLDGCAPLNVIKGALGIAQQTTDLVGAATQGSTDSKPADAPPADSGTPAADPAKTDGTTPDLGTTESSGQVDRGKTRIALAPGLKPGDPIIPGNGGLGPKVEPVNIDPGKIKIPESGGDPKPPVKPTPPTTTPPKPKVPSPPVNPPVKPNPLPAPKPPLAKPQPPQKPVTPITKPQEDPKAAEFRKQLETEVARHEAEMKKLEADKANFEKLILATQGGAAVLGRFNLISPIGDVASMLNNVAKGGPILQEQATHLAKLWAIQQALQKELAARQAKLNQLK